MGRARGPRGAACLWACALLACAAGTCDAYVTRARVSDVMKTISGIVGGLVDSDGGVGVVDSKNIDDVVTGLARRFGDHGTKRQDQHDLLHSWMTGGKKGRSKASRERTAKAVGAKKHHAHDAAETPVTKDPSASRHDHGHMGTHMEEVDVAALGLRQAAARAPAAAMRYQLEKRAWMDGVANARDDDDAAGDEEAEDAAAEGAEGGIVGRMYRSAEVAGGYIDQLMKAGAREAAAGVDGEGPPHRAPAAARAPRRGVVELQNDDDDDDDGDDNSGFDIDLSKTRLIQHCAAGRLAYYEDTTAICSPGTPRERRVRYDDLNATTMHLDGIGSVGKANASQETCFLESNSSAVCICPPDTYPEYQQVTYGDGTKQVLTVCTYVKLRCVVRTISPDPALCPPYELNTDWLLPCKYYDLRDDLNVSFRLQCEATYRDDLRPSPPDTKVFSVALGPDSFGTIEDIEERYFMRARGVNFRGFSDANPMVGEDVSARLYDFNRPSNDKWSWRWPVAALPFGQITSLQPFTAALRGENIPAQYFHGGRLYMEMGLLNSPNHSAKVFLDFEGYEPILAEGVPATTQAIFFLLITLVVVFFIVGGALCYSTQRMEKLSEKED